MDNNNSRSKKLIEDMRRNSLKIKVNGIEYDRQTIYENNELKRQLVEENPRLAENLYYQWRDAGEQEIGRLFALKYNGHEEHGASAYHIANELGILGVEKPNNPFSE
jgi:hypothetical protein